MPNHVLGGFIVRETDHRHVQVSRPLGHPERPASDRRVRVAPGEHSGSKDSNGHVGSAAQTGSMPYAEDLDTALRSLLTKSPDVEAAALIAADGRMLASALPQEIDETRVAGMTATLLGLSSRAAAEFGRSVEDVIVRGDRGYAVILSAGHGVLLLTLAGETARLGLVFFDMREAITELNRSLIPADGSNAHGQAIAGSSPI